MQGEPVMHFLSAVLAARQNPRSRRSVSTIQTEWTLGNRGRFVIDAATSAYGLYCLYRQSAVPSAPQPALASDGMSHIPRRLQRHLRMRGVVGHTMHNRQTLRQRAEEQRRHVWRKIKDRWVVLWVDNYYRRRFVANPAVGYQAISCSAVAVLYTPRIPMCPLMPSMSDLLRSRRSVADGLLGYIPRLQRMIAGLTCDEVFTDDIRVPLDVRREHVRSIQWVPFMLSKKRVSENVGFVDMLRMIRDRVLPQSMSPLPVLMDVNLYYRYVKLLYGRAYQQWDIRKSLRFVPPLYAVWHGYKHCCEKVYRLFYSQVTYILHGTVAAHRNFPAAPALRTLEMLFAAVLCLPLPLKRRTLAVVDAKVRILDAAKNRHKVAEKWRRALHRVSADDDAREVDEINQAELDVARAEAMHRLICEYIPCLFIIGHLVRESNWNGRDAHTGGVALETMQACCILLLSLLGDRAQRDQHLRTLCLGIHIWGPWLDSLRACFFSEEICEAGLGRLATMLRANTQAYDLATARDLYLLVQPGTIGYKNVRADVPTMELQRLVHSHVTA